MHRYSRERGYGPEKAVDVAHLNVPLIYRPQSSQGPHVLLAAEGVPESVINRIGFHCALGAVGLASCAPGIA